MGTKAQVSSRLSFFVCTVDSVFRQLFDPFDQHADDDRRT